ncbi:hypothetical protein T05_9314 [Trichinella murrelli]|uniref:Uncharacterized protein n=1 Tax=Trichinella murrelli TaxID=144512 RepID=A0A0V0TJP2_9BILA|nr:hypothetical protein T05_9314 [Trichinella murrelli]
MSFKLQSHHSPGMKNSVWKNCKQKRRLNEVQALYTVKHFCSCSDLLQSQFLLTKRNEMNKTKKFCLFIIMIRMSIHFKFYDITFAMICCAVDFALSACVHANGITLRLRRQQFTFKTLHTHQKKKLKNKLDHFITIKCFTMSKKWEYHVVEMPFCCCISEVITIDIGAQLQTTIKLDEHYKLDMLQNCRLLLDLVLLLLCCFLYELNLFNDLLNLI